MIGGGYRRTALRVAFFNRTCPKSLGSSPVYTSTNVDVMRTVLLNQGVNVTQIDYLKKFYNFVLHTLYISCSGTAPCRRMCGRLPDMSSTVEAIPGHVSP